MGQITLKEAIDGWLGGSMARLSLNFPPELEARFEADTGPVRSRIMMVFGGLGSLLALLLYPMLRDGMPDVMLLTRRLYLFTSIPLGFLVAASMRLNPPPLVREGAVLLANMVCICVTMYLYANSTTASETLIIAGVSLLMVYSTLGIQLRFKFAVAVAVVIILGYGMALRAHPEIGDGERRNLLLLATGTAGYLLLANWQLEFGVRYGYILVLREKLQRLALSVSHIELDALASRDKLTGLANRRAYDSWLEAAWEQERAQNGRLGLVVVDVDRFKAFNDFYGYAAGDQCLQKVALCLREQLRGTTDLVARLGGEEFAVLLPGLQGDFCADVAERMRLAVQRLELPHLGLGPRGLVTLSAGVASHVVLPVSSPAALFDAADSALYQAKISGRNQVCIATRYEAPNIEAPVAE